MTVFFAGSTVHAQIQSPATRNSEIIDTKIFSTSGRCAECHSSAPRAYALRDAKGRSVAPSDLWPTSMMANSSVDPLWRAVVAAEVAATPSRKTEIETKCLRCHTPMASVEAEIAGVTPSRELFLHGTSKFAKLAQDGVSCTVCHQIPPEQLGSDESFSGHFQIGKQRKIYGPHLRPFTMPMRHRTGYTPTESKHVSKSALCASCHTLFTNSLTPDGKPTGHMLLEQGPYVEWQNSQFNDETDGPNKHTRSCQDCHMPSTDVNGKSIKTRIARNPHGGDFPPIRPRQTFGRHVFTGGNTLMLSILRDELGETRSRTAVAGFNAAIKQTRRMLRQKTAQIKIVEAKQRDGKLNITLTVTNLTGHKLPTAYPSRRVWIRLRVLDSARKVVFVSGDFDDRGRIIDHVGDILASELVGGPVNLHLSTITSPAQVQTYEALMEDAQGEVTYSLLRGSQYKKDNRLLPKGWKSDHPRGPTTAPVGTDDDPDFTAGTDTVRYAINVQSSRGSYKIDATLYYQVLGSRYAAELFTHDVPEMQHFRKLHDKADTRPEVLDRDVRTIRNRP